MRQVIIVGLGNKARQGKDTVGGFMKELRPNVHVIHFADALYEEVRNSSRKHPLVRRTPVIADNTVKYVYSILENAERGVFELAWDDEVPYLHKIFEERKIEVYPGMDAKDSPMLQFWGTDFRRADNPNYWVERVDAKVKEIVNNTDVDLIWIAIPDVRFKNEVQYVKSQGARSDFPCHGYFVRVRRFNEDGTQYIDPSRDPNHPSEVDIDGVDADMNLQTGSGYLNELKIQTEEMLLKIEEELGIKP